MKGRGFLTAICVVSVLAVVVKPALTPDASFCLILFLALALFELNPPRGK